MVEKNKLKKIEEAKEIIIDANNAILGRLASYAAKQALQGKKIIIVNSENVVVAGRRENIIEKYKINRKRGGHSQKGPNFPSSSERILKRTIRGMLPKYGRGQETLKKIICYNKVPEKYINVKKITAGKEKSKKLIKLKEISKAIK